jgi:hypothetical protein
VEILVMPAIKVEIAGNQAGDGIAVIILILMAAHSASACSAFP